MAQKLPHDVFELLLDECQSDGADNTVGLCGLVCKAWLHPSRARLFTTVVLREHNSNSFLDIVQTSPFPIQSFIHTLHIIIRKKNTFLQETKVEVLGPFPEVTALYIDADVRDWIPEMAATFFPNKFPRLSKLSLSVSDTSLYFFDILSAVTPFPTLESLEMDVAGGFDFTTDDVPETYRIPPNWHTLHFDMDMGNIFLEMMFDLASDSDSDSDSEEFSIPLFSTLRLQDSWPQGRSFFGRYLHTYGHKIHRLGFDCASENTSPTRSAVAPLSAVSISE
ncbi:hypothetical protein DFH07DRAFT_396503 [Mycena maculata]|uniref:Uncharacterized protein n=1 Tax=Mycena maculata TaxID=230809 RepID=A0AAD7JG05_9AGAR|nr:hypothetical protein DFH07DRAFT_396503 [Mycena maculata]